ncbi:MAG: hypothetical protein QNJ35_18265 [Paracoccaceae bacterium]|nr:hypothetical protein [Paracoccaceae bacterium]
MRSGSTWLFLLAALLSGSFGLLTAPESFGELAYYAVNNAWIELDAYDAVHATFTVITLSVAAYLSFQAYRASNSKNENNVARVVAWGQFSYSERCGF